MLTRARPCTLPLPAPLRAAFACLCSPPCTLPVGRYTWSLANTVVNADHTLYVLRLTSQTWLTPDQIDVTVWTRTAMPPRRCKRSCTETAVLTEVSAGPWVDVPATDWVRMYVRIPAPGASVSLPAPSATPHLIEPMDMLLTSPRLSGVIF